MYKFAAEKEKAMKSLNLLNGIIIIRLRKVAGSDRACL